MPNNTVKNLIERAKANGYVVDPNNCWVVIPMYFLSPEFMASVGYEDKLFEFLDSINE